MSDPGRLSSGAERRVSKPRSAPNPQLPLDADIEADESPSGDPRPIHLRLSFIALVALGGAVGTAAREAITLAVPDVAGIPVATFGINVAGAFLLGVLLEALVRRGPDAGRRRRIRLLLGTGALGGFTTYSALAVDTVQLAASPASAVLYGLGTVIVGGLATWAGIALAAAAHRRRAIAG